MSSVGQIVGGVIGALVGLPLGNPFLGAQLGMMVGGYLDPLKGPTVEGPRLTDKTVQTSTYGTDIPTIYGAVAVNGNVFWLENNTLKEVVTKKKSGGKGGGPKITTKTFSYYATFAVGLSKGPVLGIRRIWIAGRLFYDAGSSDPATIQASNQAASGFVFYPGTDTQMPDPRMQATLGVENTPAYRGLAYIVFYDLPLADYSNSLMGAQVRVEVMTRAAVYNYPVTTFNMPTAEVWYEPVWDGTVWCAASGTNPRVSVSSDGLNWSNVSLPYVANWSGLGTATDGAGTLLAYGRGGVVLRSVDHGQNWTIVSSPAGPYWITKIIWDGARFVGCTDTGSWMKSWDNGQSWVWQVPPGGEYAWYSKTLTWNGSVFAVIQQNGTGSPRVWTSPSGETGSWTSRGTLGNSSNNFQYMMAKNGVLVAVGMATINSVMQGGSWVSVDNGVTWNLYPLPGGIGPGSGCANANNFWFVANYHTAGYSPDGINWTTVSMNPINYGPCSIGANDTFVICLCAAYGAAARIQRTLVTPDLVPLSTIVSAECYRTGLLSPGDIDTSNLSSTIRGFLVSGSGSVRNSLEILQGARPFDIRQHGYKIQFVSRGSSAVATIPLADLGAGTGDPVVMTTIQRTPDLSLPRRTSVKYLDYDREYNIGEQYASRDTVQSYNTHSVDFPLVLTGTEAAGMAETLLYLYWMERYELEFSLPATYNNLEPGDVVNLTTPEGVVSVRLVGVNNTSTNIVECKGRFNSAAVYSPTAVAATPVTAGNTTITPLGGVKYELLDVPMVSSAQSSPSFLLAMTGLLDGWKGGTLMQSADSGATWYSLQDVDPPGTTMGYCSNSIGVVDSRTVDSASVLSVTMTQGDLYSVTQAAMFGGQNYFAYGADGRWEIIAVQTCTLVSASNYNLTNMLRGRAGTEWAMGLHQAGDALVLLDATDVPLVNSTSDMIGVPSVYRGITFGRDISTDSNKSFTYRAVNLTPLSPINLTGCIDAGTGDWTLSFTPRTRDTSGWRDFMDSAFVESSEAYQIDVFSDNTYASVKRTLSASTPSVSYSSANQTTDFGGNQNTLYLKIYQMSSAVGRGYPLKSSITR